MLVLSRAEAAGDFETEPVLLQRLLPRIASDLHKRSFRANVQIDIPEDLHPASAQPVYVEQIVGNLVSNAVKYSPAGGPIEIRARQDGDYILVVVEDRGAGITGEEAGQVFMPFFRSRRTAGQAGGIGLGLAVCKRLVEVQGGRVWAAPREGGGTTIGFTLPIAKVQLTG
jgi:two-component system sensor histidine kinase KdpD